MMTSFKTGLNFLGNKCFNKIKNMKFNIDHRKLFNGSTQTWTLAPCFVTKVEQITQPWARLVGPFLAHELWLLKTVAP